MTPAARLAAAIEVLDEIAASRGSAEDVIRAWGRAHRFAGSKDRRAIAERVYVVLRARARLAWDMGGESARALVIGSLARLDGVGPAEIETLFSGEGYGPAPLSGDERRRLAAARLPPPPWVEAGVPAFVAEALERRFGADWIEEARGLIGGRAPLDLRVNTLRGSVEQAISLLAVDGLEPERTPYSALGLRLPPELAPDVQKLRAFNSGWVEVQDEASHMAVALADARPGMTVVDYCAGGGGKTLALGAAMRARRGAPEGRLVALDVNPKRLAALEPRLERADVAAEVRRIGSDGQGAEDLTGQADLVFVDAPCSGSGTWRRHPEAAWRITPEGVARLSELQRAILDRASTLVRPGGRLVYATCSVLAEENDAVAADFSAAHPEFRPLTVTEVLEDVEFVRIPGEGRGPGLNAGDGASDLDPGFRRECGNKAEPAITLAGQARLAALAEGAHTLQLTPRRTGTDGFFIALFERLP